MDDEATPAVLRLNDQLGQASEARWYCLDRDGVAMLCNDEADARAQAVENDDCWPGRAPHRAVLLGDVAALEAKSAALAREAHAWWTALADAVRWRDAAEDPPHNGQEVLATIYPYRNKINRQMIVHAVYVDAVWLDPTDREPLHEPTHWMPAPTMPDVA